MFGKGAMRKALDEYDLVHPNRGGLAVAVAHTVQAMALRKEERDAVAGAAFERASSWLEVTPRCLQGEEPCDASP